MKKLGYIILLIMLTIGTANAQPEDKQQRMERIHAIKVAYLTDKVQLTAKQSEKFWPVYRKYEEEMRSLRKQYKQKYGAGKDETSDERVRKLLDEDIELQEKMVAVRKQYKNEFLTIISPQQLATLYDSEREFKKMLVQQLKDRRSAK